MKPLINLYKPASITPLQAIELFKQQNPEYQNQKISYAGRLDPMAQGILLLLIGNENKKMTKYMKLNKEYRTQILFNFTTDTYDILGLPKTNNKININKFELKKTIKSLKGKYKQTIPPYSSHKIRGKSLFAYARQGRLKDIELPKKSVIINNIKINLLHTITPNRLLRQITNKISRLKGDFRQEQILKQWNKLLIDKNRGDSGEISKRKGGRVGTCLQNKFIVLDVTISCSSGTYIRAIAHDLGKQLQTGAILLNLIRTKIGRYDIKNAKRIN